MKKSYKKMNVNKEVKKHDPENYVKFKRLEDLSLEITRLNCVLVKGGVSSKMFDELVLKLSILQDEYLPLACSLFDTKYAIPRMGLIEEKKKEIYKKFKFTKCEWCESLIPEEDGNFCPDDDCDSRTVLGYESD